MMLLKVGGLNLISSLVRIGTQLAVTKIIALSMGAPGLVVVGQIQNLVSMLGTGSTLGTFGGVVKQTAEAEVAPHLVWSTALTMSGVMAIVFLAASVVWSGDLANFLFDDEGNDYLVVLCAAANLLVVLQSLFFHALTGLRRYKLFIVCSILNSFANLVLVAVAAAFGGGSLLLQVMCFSQAIQILGAGIAFVRTPEMTVRGLLNGVDRSALIRLLPFVAIGITTAGVFPATQLLVRSHLIATFGLVETGVWEAAMKVSTLYIALLSTAFGLYLLPTFASSKQKSELRRHVMQALSTVFVLLMVGATLQFLLRDWIIIFVFSRDFLAAADLLALQLIGDVARGLVMVLVFLATSKSRGWSVVAINLTFGATFYAAMAIWTTLPGGAIANASASYTLGSIVALLVAIGVVGNLFLGKAA